MKKSVLAFFLFTILPLALAQEIEFRPAQIQESYAPGETAAFFFILAPNTSLTTPLTASQIRLTDAKGVKQSTIQTLTRLWDKEYYYTLETPPDPANDSYTLGIYNLYSTQNGKQNVGDFLVNITILPRNITLLLRPAFFYQTLEAFDQPTFSTTLVNTGETTTLNLTTDAPFLTVQPASITLQKNAQTTITIKTIVAGDTANVYKGNILIQGKQHYTLPVILQRKGIPKQYLLVQRALPQDLSIPENNIPSGTASLQNALQLTLITEINQTIKASQQLTGNIQFKNTANQTLTNIRLTLDSNLVRFISLSEENVSTLAPGQEYTVTILLNKNKDATEDLNGILTLRSAEGATATVPITLFVEKQPLQQEARATNETGEKNITKTTTLPPKKDNTLIVVLILTLGILLIILLAYFLYRRGKPKPQKFENILEEAMQH